MALLTCKDLTVRFGSHPVFSNVSLSLSAGDYLCIVGENGSGKSSLLRALLGLIPIAGGSITFGDGLTRRGIGYLPQQTPVQRDFPATAEEVVRSGLAGRTTGLRGLLPFYSAADRKRAADALATLGASHLARQCFRTLSGGQQQRVLLARTLCAAEHLLVLDEPTGGLDPLISSDLSGEILRLNRERGLTVLAVTHDVSCAVHDATHILHLGSSARFFGTAADYAASPLGNAFLSGCDDAHHHHHREGTST